MRAHFLGTADGHTSGRDHSGILLQTAETALLVDCGAAAARFLLKNKLPPDLPEIFWISHMHSDHNGQVSSLIQSLWLRGRHAPLHVFGPAGVLRATRDWLEKSLLFPELIGFPIHWHPLKPGKAYTQGPFTLTAFSTEHLSGLASAFKESYPKTCFDCYGLVLDHAGRRYVYSADLGHPRELLPVLEKSKTAGLICELTHFPERELFQTLAGCAIDSLWLTHYPDRLAQHEAELKTIAREEKFSGAVHLMNDGIAQEI